MQAERPPEEREQIFACMARAESPSDIIPDVIPDIEAVMQGAELCIGTTNDQHAAVVQEGNADLHLRLLHPATSADMR